MVHKPHVRSIQCIVPPHLLERLAAQAPPEHHEGALWYLAHDAALRASRLGRPTARLLAAVPSPGGLKRTITTGGKTENLPGTIVRNEGDGPSGDATVDEAYDGLGATYELFSTVYGRDSIDGKGLALGGTVHYGNNYDNAFWNGDRMVFGDGDGKLFQRFTICLDVIGHELTHAVTELTAGLVYQGQSGALNESVSDVFGSLVKQYKLGQSAADADWLIGAGLFTPDVQGVALRSMAAPGTAYDDDIMGKDPQPGHMDGYVTTDDDNGGVHLNSGIPNKAFHLVATALGGNAWESAGAIWYRTLTDTELTPDADFAAFAAATVRVASALGSTEAAATKDAWTQVGVKV